MIHDMKLEEIDDFSVKIYPITNNITNIWYGNVVYKYQNSFNTVRSATYEYGIRAKGSNT